MKQETVGVLFILVGTIFWGAFPVMIYQGGHLPALTFAAMTTLFAATIFFAYTLFKKRLVELCNKKVLGYLFAITLFIVVIPYSLLFLGAGQTSGINVAMLLLFEIIFLLLFTPLFGEKTTIPKVIGALGVFIGGFLLLYNGSFSLNKGDLLIILSTATYPFGNFYAKKALNYVSSSTILFFRFFVGGLFLLVLALFFEKTPIIFFVQENWWLLVLTGFILLGVGKALWYEGLKRLDISKAITLASTFPLVSVFLLVFFFAEPITTTQIIGSAIMIIGGVVAARRHSVDPQLTKYAK